MDVFFRILLIAAVTCFMLTIFRKWYERRQFRQRMQAIPEAVTTHPYTQQESDLISRYCDGYYRVWQNRQE